MIHTYADGNATASPITPAPTPDEIDIRTTVLAVDEPVEVRSRFDQRWTHGFSVAEVGAGAYLLRRLSDGSVLPAWFPDEMVRPDAGR
jgi:hypothetical protein